MELQADAQGSKVIFKCCLYIIHWEAQLTRLPFRLVSTTAKLKTKKLVGFGANEVRHVI
jgi:hypothetical protein